MTSPFSRRVLLALLRAPPQSPVSARALTAASGVSRTVVNDVLRFLEFHNALESRPTTRVSWDKVAQLAADLRLADLVPAREHVGSASLENVHRALDESGIDHVFAFTTAANRWAFFEPDPDLHVVVGPRAVADAQAAIESTQPPTDPGFRRVLVYTDHLEALETTPLNGIPLTSHLQTWLDLRRFPHAAAHAAFFESVIRAEREERA